MGKSGFPGRHRGAAPPCAALHDQLRSETSRRQEWHCWPVHSLFIWVSSGLQGLVVSMKLVHTSVYAYKTFRSANFTGAASGGQNKCLGIDLGDMAGRPAGSSTHQARVCD
ncbi:hypothetical protein LY76DRAFT_276939 [Colletotrichum caudatum]|nr:hypothetical protein LY76DRAFT_276939 [Colletotrichum caudatum]